MEEKTLKIIPKSPVVLLLLGFFVFFILLALYFKFVGPIPVSVNSVVTTKTDLFTVSGEGKVVATPTIAKINLGISTNSATVKEAQNQANQIINKIIEDLEKMGIEKKDIKTTSYNINPNYDFSSGKQRITGFQANINLEVTARDLDKVNQVIDTATADGANLVGGLQFTIADEKLKELQKQARDEAIKKAKEKAQSLSQSAGINLGKIVNVQEEGNQFMPPRFTAMDTAMGGGGEPTKVEPGEQEIVVSVSLSYEIR